MSRASAGAATAAAWSSRAAFAVEAVATAALAVLLAQLVWLAYPPFIDTPRASAASLSSASALASSDYNPFRPRANVGAEADSLADAPETTLNLQVVGLRSEAGEAGPGGSAIIQTPDNQQRVYRIGDIIVDGVTLAAIEPRRVVILRDGQPESISLVERASVILPSVILSGGAAAAGPPSTMETDAKPAVGRVAGQALLNGVDASPRPEGGMEVRPRGDGAAFAAAGFEPFDVLLAVNGVALDDPDSWASAFAGVGSGSTLVVEAERAGMPVIIQFVLE